MHSTFQKKSAAGTKDTAKKDALLLGTASRCGLTSLDGNSDNGGNDGISNDEDCDGAATNSVTVVVAMEVVKKTLDVKDMDLVNESRVMNETEVMDMKMYDTKLVCMEKGCECTGTVVDGENCGK